MAITVYKHGDRYQVVVSPPHATPWRSTEPLTATDVLAKLAGLDCHSTDVTDALYEADPSWAAKHDAEFFRRRRSET